MILRVILFISFFSALCIQNLFAETVAEKPYVIMISIDGYRHDYTQMYQPPNLLKISQKSHFPHRLKPIYPSKTFPNHISQITGKYPVDHGIIGNTFFNRLTKEPYAISNEIQKSQAHWYQSPPIWVELENIGIKTASLFWPGSDVNLFGTYPSYYKKYDKSLSNKDRIMLAHKWFSLEEEVRPQLVLLYFSQVDSMGHKYGPASPQVEQAVGEIDALIGDLQNMMKSYSFPVNLVVVSDHGMKEVVEDKIIYLEDYINFDEKIKISGSGSVFYLYVDGDMRKKEVYENLKKCPHVNVFYRENIPLDYKVNHTEHMSDIMIEVLSPYYMARTKNDSHRPKGEHGYHPKKEQDMDGIFYAVGKHLSGFERKSMEATDIYYFLKKILF